MAGISKCCCDCWYHIPLCPCEDDDEDCPLFLDCVTVDDFFAAHPELNNHLLFQYFDGMVFLCYDMKPDPALKVTALPPGACELDDVPPPSTWFLPPQDQCSFCCPGCGCGACPTGIEGDPVCCYQIGDTGSLTLTTTAAAVSVFCCNTGNTHTSSCPAVSYSAQYEVCECDGAVVRFCKVGGAACLPAIMQYNCGPGGGWASMPHSCGIPDPCDGFLCNLAIGDCCGFCFVNNPCCFASTLCTAAEGFEPTCSAFRSTVRLPYLKFTNLSCNSACPDPSDDCPSDTVCDCQEIINTWTSNPTCIYDPDSRSCEFT